MKSLSLLNDDTTIKLGDTGTMIQFTATNNEAPVQLTENQTAQFRLKNDFGLVKTINATTTYNGLIFQFDTADLKGLVQGKYQVELAVNVDKDNTLIFPDEGFVSFTLSANALNIVGQQLNLISLDDFKEQANQYIQQQTQDLESNFDNYVAKIKQGPQGEQGPTGPQGPKGDTGEQGPKGDTGTIQLGNTSSSIPQVIWNSSGQTYLKGYVASDGSEHTNTTDVGTDYIQAKGNDMYTIQLPANMLPFTGGAKLRVIWFDNNKSAINTQEVGPITPPYAWTVQAPNNTNYMRLSFYVGTNVDVDGNKYNIVITDLGNSNVTNSGNDLNANLQFNLASGPVGTPGIQGTVGPTGPAGGFGDYVTGTGWLDLSPFMNTQVWCGWDPDNTPSDIGYNKYAVTSINGQNIFWFRIHSRFKDASIANNWGTKLFDIPADVQKQYGGMEASQYQGGIYECNGQPCLTQLVGNAGSRYVQTRGALQMQNKNNTFSGTTTVNYEGWFIL